MRWIKCNRKHALSSDYDYFWQSPSTSSLWATFGNARNLIQTLRQHHGTEFIGPLGPDLFRPRQRNPKWFLDRKRYRIWVKEETLVMLQLRGIG